MYNPLSGVSTWWSRNSTPKPWNTPVSKSINLYFFETLDDKLKDNLEEAVREAKTSMTLTPLTQSDAFKIIEALCKAPPITECIQQEFFAALKESSSSPTPQSNYFDNRDKNDVLTELCYRAIENNKEELAIQILDLISESETITGLFNGQSLYIFALEKGFKTFLNLLLKKLPASMSIFWSGIKREYDEKAKISLPDPKSFFMDELSKKFEKILEKKLDTVVDQFVECLPYGNGFIHPACKCGSSKIILAVLKKTPDASYKNKDGHPALYLAAQRPEVKDVLIPLIKKIIQGKPFEEALNKLEEEVKGSFPEEIQQKVLKRITDMRISETFSKLG